jgi:hypothetical protein
LALDPEASTAFPFTLEVYGFYSTLIARVGDASESNSDNEPSLGGKLLYAGELDEGGRALMVAGNIAGAASLVATLDTSAQKQAIRDGVVDFLVTSLDEALRILKNEIRKRGTVAVCVSLAPMEIEREMLERGVLPDLFRPDQTATTERQASLTSAASSGNNPMSVPALVQWSVASAPAQWLPKLDAIALDCLDSAERIVRRWIRLSPRYLGRLAHGLHLAFLDRAFGAKFVERIREHFERGEIGVHAQIQVSFMGGNEEHNFGQQAQAKND